MTTLQIRVTQRINCGNFGGETVCYPMDRSLPGSSVHGISQAKILEWVAHLPPPGDLPDPGIESASLRSPALAGGFFTPSVTREAFKLRKQNSKNFTSGL